MTAGHPEQASTIFQQARSFVESESGSLRQDELSRLIYLQGMAGLRLGENDNCILCRGESSCIIPISAAAVHQNRAGSQQAIAHFSEYLQHFPEDLEVRWLLNLAHMTLGEYPDKVDPRYVIQLDRFFNSEFDIGRFRDIGHIVGVNRLNQAGGAIMDDFDNDGLLDLVTTAADPNRSMAVYRNTGEGTFEDCGKTAGVEDQLGGLNCVQTDYDNDGLMDVFIPRGAWMNIPIRPSLLRNDGKFHFTDVTEEAGLMNPGNSNTALWADYDNDGWLDLFVPCERQPSRLYRNLGNGTFKEVTHESGISRTDQSFAKGANWIDYDNDDFPDLFVNFYGGVAQLFHNNRNGTFTNVTSKMGIFGPEMAFSCWAWDFDNDGWLDIFATSYDRSVEGVIKSLTGKPHGKHSNKLYRNMNGREFFNVARETGLDMVFETMGSNYGDFDNDGFLDMYLGTGDPDFSTLIPNRMFKSVGGKRFSEITVSAGVGHLQKGHGIACGDWDRDGNVDLFIEMGGVVPGDQYHNILFQNPGHDNSWLTVKLVGQKTNRAAIGARIKVVTAADKPLTVHRHVSSGSSFGASPLEQTIGLDKARRIAELEIRWPASQTTQVFRDLDVNQSIKVTEFADGFEVLDHPKISRTK